MIPNREREDKTINKKSTFIRDKSNFQNQRQYSRENLQSNEHSDIVQLPGQIDTNSPVDQPKSRNYANQRIMNKSGLHGDQDAGQQFSGMYQNDSNFRWRKVRGNLDLFVMERNERHLTSLQWKWQKLPKSRRRTPQFEQEFFNVPTSPINSPPVDEPYKSNSERTRSRAESRQRMREELDTYFYDRWKNADDRQNLSRPSGEESKMMGPNRNKNPYKNNDQDVKQGHYPNSNQHPALNHQYQSGGPGDSAKWSRYGNYPEINGYQQQKAPGMMSGYPSPNSRMGQRQPYPTQQHRRNEFDQNQYYGNSPRRGPNFSRNFQENGYGQFSENQDNYGPYWGQRGHHYPPEYPTHESPYHPKYGYAPDYGNQPYPPHHHEYNPHQYGKFSENRNIPGGYDYRSQRPIDPWMKKDIHQEYDNKRNVEISPFKEEFQSYDNSSPGKPNPKVPFNAQNRNPIYQNDNFSHSRQGSRVSENRQFRPASMTPANAEHKKYSDYSREGFKFNSPVSRCGRRIQDEHISEVTEGDDDVFGSPPLSPRRGEEEVDRWAENSKPTSWNESNRGVDSPSYGQDRSQVLPEQYTDEPDTNPERVNWMLHDNADYFDNRSPVPHRILSPKAMNESLLKSSPSYNSPSPARLELSCRLSTTTHFPDGSATENFPLAEKKSYGETPPLVHAEHLSSVRANTSASIITPPQISASSTNLSSLGSGRRRGSGKRVAFAPLQNPDDAQLRAITPKRGRRSSVCVVPLSSAERETTPKESTSDQDASQKLFTPENSLMGIRKVEINTKDSAENNPDFYKNRSPEENFDDVEPLFAVESLNVEDKNHDYTVDEEIMDNEKLCIPVVREITSIHVGDVDEKSDIFQGDTNNDSEQATKFVDVLKNEEKPVKNGIEYSESKPLENVIMDAVSDGKKLEKSKSTLWQLAKSLQKRMGTRLSLRREKSKVAPAVENQTISPPVCESNLKGDVKKNEANLNFADRDPVKSDVLNENKLSDADHDVTEMTQVVEQKITTAKNKETISENNITRDVNNITSDTKQEIEKNNVCNIATSRHGDALDNITYNALQSEVIDPKKCTEICGVEQSNLKDNEEKVENKTFYEEESKLLEKRRINEEASRKLLDEQKEMENELRSLRALLDVEMQRQEESNDVSNKFSDKLSEMERQIAELDQKMAETNTKLREKEHEQMELRNLVTQGTCQFPINPLFILHDKEHGTAAAVAEGNYEDDILSESTTQLSSREMAAPYYSNYKPNYNQEQYKMSPEVFNETKKQQEILKSDLENQMAIMKAELESRLLEQQRNADDQFSVNSDSIIDERVTNLEKKIEEMNKKIMEAEQLIIEAEQKKKDYEKEQVLKNNDLESNVKRPLDLKLSNKENSASSKSPFSLDKKFQRFSPKVSPAPVQKALHLSSRPVSISPTFIQEEDEEKRRKKMRMLLNENSSSQSPQASVKEIENIKMKEEPNSQVEISDIKTKPVNEMKNVEDGNSLDGVIMLEDFDDENINSELNGDIVEKGDNVGLMPVNQIKDVDSPKKNINKDLHSVIEGVQVDQDIANDSLVLVISRENSKENLSNKNFSTKTGDKDIKVEGLSFVETSNNLKQSEFQEPVIPEKEKFKSEISEKENSKSVISEKESLNSVISDKENLKSVIFEKENLKSVMTEKENFNVSDTKVNDKKDGNIAEKSKSGSVIAKNTQKDKTTEASKEVCSKENGDNLVLEKVKTIILEDIYSDDGVKSDESIDQLLKEVPKKVNGEKMISKDVTKLDDKNTSKHKMGYLQKSLKEKSETTTLKTTPVTTYSSTPSKTTSSVSRVSENLDKKTPLRKSSLPLKSSNEPPFSADNKSSMGLTSNLIKKDKDFPVKSKLNFVESKKQTASPTGVKDSLKKESNPKKDLAKKGYDLKNESTKKSLDLKKNSTKKGTDLKKETTKELIKPPTLKSLKSKEESKPSKWSFSTLFKFDDKVSKTKSEKSSKLKEEGDKKLVKDNKTEHKKFNEKSKDDEIKRKHKKSNEKSKDDETSVKTIPSKTATKTPFGFMRKFSPEKNVEATTSKPVISKSKSKPKEKETKKDKKSEKKTDPVSVKSPILSDEQEKSSTKSTKKDGIAESNLQKGNKPKITTSDASQKSIFSVFFGKSTPKHDSHRLDVLSSQKLKPKPSTASTWNRSFKSKSKSISANSATSGSSMMSKPPRSKGGLLSDREMTITTVDSDFIQMDDNATVIESRNSEWTPENGWRGSRKSLLRGLGTTWCVCPEKVWKHLGDENDDEPITRRKCISLIMGIVLAVLLLAIVIGLVIGLATSLQEPTESPIKFVVIPGESDSPTDGG